MQWKDVVGFESYFSVSECGEVWSKRTSKLLTQNLHPNGYYTLATKIGGRDGICYCFKVHRLVAEAFLPAPSDDLLKEAEKTVNNVVIVRHLDDNKINNHYTNLAWGTYKENSQDWMNSKDYLQSISKRSGVRSKTAKLDDAQVSEIRKNYRRGCSINGARALAERYNVVHSVISRLVNGITYKESEGAT